MIFQDCFILDTGSNNGIFAWIGKNSSKEEKFETMKSAEGFLAQYGLPKWTKVMRIVQGTETTVFKQYFKTWKEPGDVIGFGRAYPLGSIGMYYSH